LEALWLFLKNSYALTKLASRQSYQTIKINRMKPGLSRFNFFLSKLQPLFTTASNQRNPALWLYRNDARTSLFMLEGLSKMYAEFHNKKRFTRLREQVKLLEDGLGAIDYYDNMAKDLAANKKVPAPAIGYLQAQSREKIQRLNELLAENGWLLAKDNRISKFLNKLETADWMDEADEARHIDEFYGESIYKIVEFAGEKNYEFGSMESEVHELRRKIRWLSIYPHALRGAIQLGANKPYKHLVKYCTKDVTSSPFNKLPERGPLKSVLLLGRDFFYALSWMIAELGSIKDNGLHIVALKEALQQTSPVTDEAALRKVYQLLGDKQAKMPQLLDKAGTISKTYFKEQNLEHLVLGIERIK
jgi:hypothetical protein